MLNPIQFDLVEVEEGEGSKIDEVDMHCTRNCKISKYLLYQNMLSYSKVCPSHVAENTFSTCLLKQTKANVKNIWKPYGNVKPVTVRKCRRHRGTEQW